jgi:hypothetical protein
MSDFDKFVDALIEHMEKCNELPPGFLKANPPINPQETYSYFAAKMMLKNEQTVREWVEENHKALMDDFLKSIEEEKI